MFAGGIQTTVYVTTLLQIEIRPIQVISQSVIICLNVLDFNSPINLKQQNLYHISPGRESRVGKLGLYENFAGFEMDFCGMHHLKFLLTSLKMTRQDNQKHSFFKTSIASMALRIRKKNYNYLFPCMLLTIIKKY